MMNDAAVRRAPLRERGNDLYETPAVAVEALLQVEELPYRIWEPAAGRGAIANVLRAHGHDVVATDLVDYGVPGQVGGRDFLLEFEPPPDCDCLVTNPPFKIANEFVARALELCPRVVMLLRLAFWNRSGAATSLKAADWPAFTSFASAYP